MDASTEALPSERTQDEVPKYCPPPLPFDVADFTSPLVTLEVGPDATPLTAHKAILFRCSYFAKCLESGRFEEGVHNRIKLPDDTPQDLVKLLSFLYTGKLYAGDSWHPEILKSLETNPKLALMDFIGLFIIADRYCCELMGESVMAMLHQNSVTLCEKLSFCHLEKLHDAGLRESPMWNCLMEGLARGFLRPACRIDLRQFLEGGVDSMPEIASDLFKEIIEVMRNDPAVTCCRTDTWCCSCGEVTKCSCVCGKSTAFPASAWGTGASG